MTLARHVVIACLCWLILASPAAAVGKTISVGMTAAFSGPAKALGLGMKAGINAAFAEWNARASEGAARLSLIARDDSYDPEAAGDNTRRLIEENHVLALIGNVGTPTARVAAPIAAAAKVLFFGAMTGASLIRPQPPSRYLIHLRASYQEETAAMVEGLLSAGVKVDEIAFLTQDDAYGEDGFQGAMAALKAKGYADADRLPRGRYARNSLDVEPALIQLLQSRRSPRAVIMVAAYRPAAKFITLGRQLFPDALFLNLSFVGSDALARALGPAGRDVIITQVAPTPDSDLPAVRAYRRALARHEPQASFDLLSLEGYLTARVLIEGIKRAGPNPDREAVIDGLLSLGAFDIGLGMPLRLSAADHQASHRVWPTRLVNGQVTAMNWSDLAKTGE